MNLFKKSRKISRTARISRLETLENRSLMAANVFMSGNTLVIQGTGGNDSVAVSGVNDTTIQVSAGPNTKVMEFPQGSIRNVSVNLGAGDDYLEINYRRSNDGRLHAIRNLEAIDAVYGGTAQILIGNNGPAQRVTVQAAPGAGRLDASFSEFNELGSLTVETGNANDKIFIGSSKINNVRLFTNDGADGIHVFRSTVGSIVGRTGRGDDWVNLQSSTIQNSNINLGRGKDTVQLDNATIESGVLSGGDGQDTIFNFTKPFRRVTRSFESIR